MRHIEVRDLWLQTEVAAGRVKVVKVKGDENPADLMTKFLKVEEIRERLERMGIRVEPRRRVKVVGGHDRKRRSGMVGSVERKARGRWADDETDSAEDGEALVRWWKGGCVGQPRGSRGGLIRGGQGRSRRTTRRR